MKTGKKFLIAVLIVAVLTFMLSACGKGNKIAGTWYNEDGKTLSVQTDGTYNYEGEYGTGTWKVLDDKKTIALK